VYGHEGTVFRFNTSTAVEPGVGQQLVRPPGGAGVVAGAGDGFDVDEGVPDQAVTVGPERDEHRPGQPEWFPGRRVTGEGAQL
jgi:hypothetical protein